MDAPPSALDELDCSCVLHSLGALAVDLQDLVSHLELKRMAGRWGGGYRGQKTGEGTREERGYMSNNLK